MIQNGWLGTPGALRPYVPALRTSARPARSPARGLARGVIRIGYVPLIDATPLLMARELNLFEKAGLNVRLEREFGWGSIREKIVYGELEAAHAPGGLLFSIVCGTHSRPCRATTDLVLNLQGNAVTLSKRLWTKGVRDGATLRQLMRSEAPRKPLFAVASHFSTHGFLLRKWLVSVGIDPDRDARIAVLPPSLVAEQMKEGHIDGFCVGEPWNSVAALAGEGWIAATSTDLAPLHPEKVLIAGEALRQREDEYAALRQVILKACEICDTPSGRTNAVEVLHSRKLFPVDREALGNSLVGPLQRGAGQTSDSGRFIYFSKNDANRASRERAVWLLDALASAPITPFTGAQRRACLDSFNDSPVEFP